MFNITKKAISEQPDERVEISLKSLINLVGPAAGLALHKSGIKSRQSGGYVSRFKGRGMEFDETRLYQPGDDVRSIDWRVTARTGKTHTKLFREERERPVFISVDKRPAMHFATRGVFKSVQVAKLAALLAWAAQHHGDRVGGQVYDARSCCELKPQNGRHAVLRLLNSILQPQQTEGAAEISLQQVMSRLVQHVRPGSLVYLISDFRGLDVQVENSIARLEKHCDVVLIQVYDPLESSLPEQGRYRFTDGINDVLVDSDDRERVSGYHQRFQTHQHTLQSLAKKMHMAFIQCSTHDIPLQVLR